MLVLAGVAFFVTALGASASAATTTHPSCVTAAAATYRHTFHGAAGTTTITAVHPLCAGQSQAFSLVSNTAAAATSTAPPFVYDTDHAVADAKHRSVTLHVAVPGCFTQVAALVGSAVPASITGNTAVLGSASGIGHRSSGAVATYSGGKSLCAPQPAVSFTSTCDGGFTATLADRAAAKIDAVFLVDGHTYRVAPGSRTTVVGEAGGTLTVRDNTPTTSTGTWSMPAHCVQPTPVVTIVPTPPAAAVPSSAAPVTVAPSTAARTSTVPVAATPAPSTSLAVAAGTTFVPTPPAAVVQAKPGVTALPVAGSGAGSLALIALGLLLAGGGLFILGRQVHRARQAV